MTDPFHDLYEPVRPVDADPVFARRLRARLERAVARPKGVVPVTAPAAERSMPRAAAVPYLAVVGAAAAIDWYRRVFDAHLVGEPVVMPDGRIGHSELLISGGSIFLSDAHPEIGVTAPRPGESNVSLVLTVRDADALREQAMAAGASGDRPPYDGHGTRNAWIVDPFGHRWLLQSPISGTAAAPASTAYRHGDVGYVSLWTPDGTRAADFYAAVLGWEVSGGHRVVGRTPDVGIQTTDVTRDLYCCYGVDDLITALERVTAAGGEAGEASDEPWGSTAMCTDDQGTRFALYQLPDVPAGLPRPAGDTGDLRYLTLEVVDASKARAFYAAVLGWQTEPGRVADGWQVHDTFPMIGLSGGHQRATAVPMWTVADVTDAVERVRAHGGTATEPAGRPYGVTSECADDQGLRFYLGQI